MNTEHHSTTLPLAGDTIRVLEAKILLKLNGVGGAAGGSTQILTGAFANPQGNVTPADPTKAALYYQEGAGAGTTLYEWSVANQVWV